MKITDLGGFRGLSNSDKKILRRAALSMSYPAGSSIQEAGSVDRRLVVVVEGLVKLDDGVTVRECGTGTAFGDAGSYGRSLLVTATAITSVRTFQVPSPVVAALMKRDRSLQEWLSSEPEDASLAG